MAEQVADALERLQEHAGKRLGDDEDPLLVSVRSGARESMPGMLDTVLNLGLNDTSVEGLARATDNERFAWDSYRRFVQMFGNVSRDVPRREVRVGDQGDQGRSRGGGRHRPRRGRAEGAHEALPGALRVPAGPAGAAPAVDPRGVRLLDGRPRRLLPAHQPHPGRVGHGGQRPADGVRQHRRRVRDRRRVQPRRGDRRAGAVRRLPHQRPGRGRRLRSAQHARHRRHEGADAGGARGADGHPAHARGALQGHAGHRVHGPGRAAVHAPDPQRQAPGAGGRAVRLRRGRRGPAHARGGDRHDRPVRARRAAAPDVRPDGRLRGAGERRERVTGGGEGRGRVHRRRRRRRGGGGPRRDPRAAVHRGRGRRPASTPPGASSPPRAARPRTRRSWPAGWAARRWSARRRWRSTSSRS